MSSEHKATQIVSLRCHGLYDVLFNGEVIVKNAASPFTAACRALVARNLVGKLLMYDQRGMLCLIGDITKASKQTIQEGNRDGPTFVQ